MELSGVLKTKSAKIQIKQEAMLVFRRNLVVQRGSKERVTTSTRTKHGFSGLTIRNGGDISGTLLVSKFLKVL